MLLHPAMPNDNKCMRETFIHLIDSHVVEIDNNNKLSHYVEEVKVINELWWIFNADIFAT